MKETLMVSPEDSYAKCVGAGTEAGENRGRNRTVRLVQRENCGQRGH